MYVDNFYSKTHERILSYAGEHACLVNSGWKVQLYLYSFVAQLVAEYHLKGLSLAHVRIFGLTLSDASQLVSCACMKSLRRHQNMYALTWIKHVHVTPVIR